MLPNCQAAVINENGNTITDIEIDEKPLGEDSNLYEERNNKNNRYDLCGLRCAY
jgi:hypothetical protein